jgi:hypothetical protein
MTEHVHELVLLGDGGWPGVCIVCNELDCDYKLSVSDAEARLNAAERLSVVFDETKRQDEKWGEQRTHPPEWWYPIMGEEFGELGKAMLENHFDYPNANPADIKKELVQVIAVGIQWLKSIAHADILEGK